MACIFNLSDDMGDKLFLVIFFGTDRDGGLSLKKKKNLVRTRFYVILFLVSFESVAHF